MSAKWAEKGVKKAFLIEEGSDDPPVVETEETEETDEEEDDDDFNLDMDDMNIGDVLQNFLVNEDGVNFADVLTGLKKSIDNQNKIILKMLNLIIADKKQNSQSGI